MNRKDFDENQWEMEQPGQDQQQTVKNQVFSDDDDSGSDWLSQSSAASDGSDSNSATKQGGFRPHVPRYANSGNPSASAGGSGGGATPKRPILIAMILTLGIAASGIFGIYVATGQLWLGKKYTVTVVNGSGSGKYRPGDTVTIQADSAEDGYAFAGWKADKNAVILSGANSEKTSFIMPRNDVTVEVGYEELVLYTVTVNGGSIAGGDRKGSFKKGETVTIVANVKSGYYFSNWKVEKGNVEINDITAEQASFVSVETDVVITAVTKACPVLRPGPEINAAFRELAGTTQADYDDIIEAVVYTDETPPPGTGTAELAESGDPVTAWFDKGIGTVFINTTANKVLLNKNSSSMFRLSALEKVDLWKYDTSGVTDMSEMFCGCNLTELDLSSFDTSGVTDMSDMFHGCNLTELDLSSFDTSSVTDMSGMFESCWALRELKISSFDTSSVTDMSDMFKCSSDLTELDLSNFDTSSVTDMSGMFDTCWALRELKISNFDTSSVTDMSGMFCSCDLTELDLSNFDTSSVTNMSEMFSCCLCLTELDLSNFDTSSVTDMSGMFDTCWALRELKISNFDTSSVTDMSEMFYGCNNLTNLDTSNFDMSSVIYKDHMFD